MKNVINYVVIILIATIMSSCSNQELEQKDDGLFYAIGETIPYTGDYSVSYSNGNDSIIAKIVDGKLDGNAIVYYPNGVVSDSLSYSMGDIESRVSFMKDGSVICDCEEVAWDDENEAWMTISEPKQIYTGTCRTYWDNGNLKYDHSFKAGKRFGIWKDGYKNGQIKSEYKYEDNDIVSDKEWYDNGQQKYIKDMKNITFKMWYENGKKHIENTKLVYKGWYEDGSVAFEITSNKVLKDVTGELYVYKYKINEFKNIWKFEDYILKGKILDKNGDFLTLYLLKDELIIHQSAGRFTDEATNYYTKIEFRKGSITVVSKGGFGYLDNYSGNNISMEKFIRNCNKTADGDYNLIKNTSEIK